MGIAANWFGASGLLSGLAAIGFAKQGFLSVFLIISIPILILLVTRLKLIKNTLDSKFNIEPILYFYGLIFFTVVIIINTVLIFKIGDIWGIFAFHIASVLIGMLIGYFYGYKILFLAQESLSLWPVIKIGFLGGTLAFFILISIISVSVLVTNIQSPTFHLSGSLVSNFLTCIMTYFITLFFSFILFGWICSIVGIISALMLYYRWRG